jgi:hypothetical protein
MPDDYSDYDRSSAAHFSAGGACAAFDMMQVV